MSEYKNYTIHLVALVLICKQPVSANGKKDEVAYLVIHRDMGSVQKNVNTLGDNGFILELQIIFRYSSMHTTIDIRLECYSSPSSELWPSLS